MASFYLISFVLSLSLKLGASSFETEVRVLSSLEITEYADPCVLLTSRAQDKWLSGMLSLCQIAKVVVHPNNYTEVIFKIQVTDEKLENGLYAPEMYDFKMWELNRMINGKDSETCATITGVGHWIDSYTSAVAATDYIPREQMITVAPFDEQFCEQFKQETLGELGIYVMNCELVVKSEELVDGVHLAKYRLHTLDTRWQLNPSDFYDNHIIFLRHLNNGMGQCSINGYWAKGHIVIPTDVRLYSEERILNTEDACSALKGRATEPWESALFSECIFDENRNAHGGMLGELLFSIQVNTSKMPEDYEHGLNKEYFNWYVNRLVNGLGKICQTATGETSFNAFLPTPFTFHGFKNETAISLVGPLDAELCDKITGDQMLHIQTCSMVHKLKDPLGGLLLAKYRLSTNSQQVKLTTYVHRILKKLNGEELGCRYNGNWNQFLAQINGMY